MGLTSTISYQDGSAAASNLSNGANAVVTAGNTLTIAPQSSTGFLQWTVVVTSDYGPLNQSYTLYGPTWQVLVPLPTNGCKLTVVSEATDGNNLFQSSNTFVAFPMNSTGVYRVRGVVTSNVSSLSSFTVASNDGLTYAAGQVVLLTGQSTAAQNGPYVVGAVASGTAPLTRPNTWPTGYIMPVAGCLFSASEGTKYAGSQWSVTTAAPITVDTTGVTIAQIGPSQYDHQFSSNTSALAVGSAAAGVVLATCNLTPKVSGKYRLTAVVNFLNSSGAVHGMQLLLTTQSGTAATSTILTGPTVACFSGTVNGACATLQYEMSAGLAVAASGGSGVANLVAVADSSTCVSVAANMGTLTCQEIL